MLGAKVEMADAHRLSIWLFCRKSLSLRGLLLGLVSVLKSCIFCSLDVSKLFLQT